MNGILLDTHALLWWICGDPRIQALGQHIEASPKPVFVSVISLWELQIKSQLGKLELSSPLSDLLADLAQCGLAGPIPFRQEHVLELERIPLIHKDPFDRALVSQARAEGLVLASHDESILRYPLETWKI